ncbi:DMT family transporter [Benzoatithermus flavus]|uniref:DMT family transporter n=1 Tax=Benzoatithermus flavus TaxID=3108223 RepID=A0ABU8XU49_9PROT
MITVRHEAGLAPDTPALGILLALASFAMFTLMDTGVKLLGGHYHVLQVTWLNSLFALLAVTAIGLCRGGWHRLRPRQWRLHVLRWTVSYAATLAIFWSYPRLPLADAYAILFASPLLVTALSVPILGERVGWRRWTAVAVGFSGVLVILAPGSGMIAWPALVALAGAVGHAFNMLIIRKIGHNGSAEPLEAVGVVGNALTLLASSLLLPEVWLAPGPADLALAAVAGAVGGAAFLLLAAAFRLAPAALVAPFQYSQMLYGILVGWLVFLDRPSVRMLVGAAIVIGSGLYVLRRETAVRRALGAAA